MEDSGESFVYAIVNNIPLNYHAADLRNFYSQFIENEGFSCFHFRHRPEVKRVKGEDSSEERNDGNTCCCIVKLTLENCSKFIKLYHKKHWIDKQGQTIAAKCFISKLKINDTENQEKTYLTREEQGFICEDRQLFTKCDLEKLAELHPPSVMPNGNVGTPTAVFMDLIRACRLPSSIIKKLGLTFPKRRSNRKYGSVRYDYGGDIVMGDVDVEERVLTASGHELTCNYIETLKTSKTNYRSKNRSPSPKKTEIQEEEEEEDDNECEEWDRHEAFHNDVTQQDRTKERLYEEEIELQWEKGGSGLVFYTDAQYWDELEGDFDAKTSDDWDIDTSVYYEKNGGDKDSQDFIQMRREQRLRDGVEEESAFEKKVGAFEKHTKGIGRKILEKQGWREGEGLGSTITGMSDALENDGQNPRNKTGFGYHGQKLQRYSSKPKRKRFSREVLIATVYDEPEEVIENEPLLRSNVPTFTKYRPDTIKHS